MGISMFEWGIESVLFSGGEMVPIEQASMLIIVGPNNSGKTTALAEIHHILSGSPPPARVVQNVEPYCRGSAEEFRDWLDSHYPTVETENDKIYVTKGASIHKDTLVPTWERISGSAPIYRSGQGNIVSIEFLCHWIGTHGRVQLGDAAKPKRYINQLDNYIHVLQEDEALAIRISEEVRRVFGKGLIINWSLGDSVGFHLGDEPTRTRDRDRVSSEYLKELRLLPRLEDEGDGIRSFIGILLAAKCGAQPVLLIDEPEAFLHPSHAERLAGILAESAEALQRQVIVATHSSAVVRGALSKSKKVAVCRLTREGRLNHASLLSSDQLKELWSKPLLKSAAAINGIFYSGVIVCEADADVRFYEALLQQLEADGQLDGPTNLYFVSGGGKGELATLARAYRKLNVPVAVIADFDLLRDKTDFEKVLSSLGGSFSEVEVLYNTTTSALNNLPRKSLEDFLATARSVFNKIEEQKIINSTDRRAITDLLDNSKDWNEAKRYGIDKLNGGARQKCRELLLHCQNTGLFLVPQGELESWWRDGPADKREWIQSVIEEVVSDNPLLSESSKFVLSIAKYLGGS